MIPVCDGERAGTRQGIFGESDVRKLSPLRATHARSSRGARNRPKMAPRRSCTGRLRAFVAGLPSFSVGRRASTSAAPEGRTGLASIPYFNISCFRRGIRGPRWSSTHELLMQSPAHTGSLKILSKDSISKWWAWSAPEGMETKLPPCSSCYWHV